MSITPSAQHKLKALKNQVLDWQVIEHDQTALLRAVMADVMLFPDDTEMAALLSAVRADLADTRKKLEASARQLSAYLHELGAPEAVS